MVVPDVGRKPIHNGIHGHKAGRFQGCFVVSPVLVATKSNTGKIMLRIEQVRTQGKSDQEW